MASLYINYVTCFTLVEHSVCHETVSVSMNVFTIFASCLLSTLLVLTLTVRELRHWPSEIGILSQNYSSDEKDGRTGSSS